jgi:DNA-binding response OmpR family regulator
VLVESDCDVAELVTLIADSNGYEIQVAIGNQQALELVKVGAPDLLVTNVRGRGIEGIALIGEVRHGLNSDVQRIPIIVMDARRRQHDIREAFACGADDYLAKPYDIVEMLRCWRMAISSVRRPSPLTALDNPDGLVRQTALAVLLEMRPDGAIDGLGQVALRGRDAHIRAAARWALRRLGTSVALDLLAGLPAAGSTAEL